MTDKESKDLYVYVGQKISELRRENGISQEKLAKLLRKKSRVSVINLEKARQQTSLHDLLTICKIFNKNIGDFIPDKFLDNKKRNNSLEKKVSKATKAAKKSSGELVPDDKLIEFLKSINRS